MPNFSAEVEEAVGERVDGLVGAGIGGHETQEGAERQQALGHTGRGEQGQDGLENTGDQVDHHIDGLFGRGVCRVLLEGVAVLVDQAAGLELTDREHGVVDVGDMRADDNLVLAAGMHDLDHAIGVLEHLVVGEGLILELEAKTRHAVREALDVVLATHVLNDDAGEAIVLTCHVNSFSKRFGETCTQRRATAPCSQPRLIPKECVRQKP